MYIDPRWLIVILGSSVSFSVLSPVIHARRLNFFAATLPHSSLLAVSLGYLLSFLLGYSPTLWAIPISVALSFLLVVLIHRGVSEDSATSAFVSFSVSASVAAMYYILTKFPSEVSLWSYILGDPLLVTWEDVAVTVVVTAVATLSTLLIYMKEVVIGLDRDFSQLLGINVNLHDYLVVFVLTLVSISLLKVVGFVLEHVVLLLPATVSVQLAKSAKEFLGYSLLVSTVSGLLGLFTSIYANVAPSAMYGFVMLGLYLAVLLRGEAR
ncbi:metal ABC transporter permease [Thermofilum pendens]|uniref:ABC-3 protein n=1 Tax=Thermofilum pendens (strain DSM 2475 / Hrk 5) TaxID=368408 RepID=A1RWF3_THEPD|nr:metal ABC transporter permease [Thermofilum pendens]ABL77533.1 ABC-3 protein [Thermofilum pendens Hrk 5]